ncbi:MAG: hypothetical protein IPF79_04810 [Ignavibacteria bacterium]|nr:hypothetical protein [Ignavibacteria bacterium]
MDSQGDWSFKGKDSRLELADFYPNPDRITYLLEQEGLVVMKLSEYQAKIRQAQRLQPPALSPEAKSEQEKADRERVTALGVEVITLKARISDLNEAHDRSTKELRRELAKANRRNGAMLAEHESEIGRLRAEYAEYLDEANAEIDRLNEQLKVANGK